MLGLWSACASVGNIIGALMVSQVLNFGYDVSSVDVMEVCRYDVSNVDIM